MTCDDFEWIYKLSNTVPQFLQELSGGNGYFSYSLTGDRFTQQNEWGLGNTVFAVKIFHTIGVLDDVSGQEKDAMGKFIKTFQGEQGDIYDPLIHREAPPSQIRQAIDGIKTVGKRKHHSKVSKRRRAESRQAFTALSLLNKYPKLPYMEIPYTESSADDYLSNLDWRYPWDAGSHFSHLVYFYRRNNDLFNIYNKQTESLKEFVINWVDQLQSSDDGCWYIGTDVSRQEKVNGAMKVISGYGVVNYCEISHKERIIDYCLSNLNSEHACDLTDIVYVLYNLCINLEMDYRYDDIRNFCKKWLTLAREHYYSEIGGFSFHKNQASQNYYGAPITKGLNEPDIHGTWMIIWGIMMVAELLDINDDLGFQEHPFLFDKF